MLNKSVPPYAKCVECQKPSWNMSDIKYSNWKWKNYYCLDCSPINSFKSADDLPTIVRPAEEVQQEIDFLKDNPLENIPF